MRKLYFLVVVSGFSCELLSLQLPAFPRLRTSVLSNLGLSCLLMWSFIGLIFIVFGTFGCSAVEGIAVVFSASVSREQDEHPVKKSVPTKSAISKIRMVSSKKINSDTIPLIHSITTFESEEVASGEVDVSYFHDCNQNIAFHTL